MRAAIFKAAQRGAAAAACLGVVAALLAFTCAAHADLRLCNRTSYVVDHALALEEKGAAATRGWFRVDPGQCRGVVAGEITAENIYVFPRALPIYGASPPTPSGHADFCVAEGNFVIAGNACLAAQGQRLARFTAVKPTPSDQGLSASLAEEADYTDDQARLAGIQRLLVIAGYDANPIDGLTGAKTEAALAGFLRDNRLPAEAVNGAAFFEVLVDIIKQSSGIGFSWCNETSLTVMAALGFEARGAVVTRGWYRLTAGACLRPELAGRPRRVFSFGEAVDPDGQPIRRADKPLAWGGPTILCTSEVRFELSDQADCAARGFNATGFATVDLAGRGATVRFKDPP